MNKEEIKTKLNKVWRFIWYEDSIASYLVNIVLAFILIKFIIYPGLGLILGTNYPIVAVVSSSMEHSSSNFDTWWDKNGKWYVDHSISKEAFKEFRLTNGFNKGDIMILYGKKPSEIQIGDIIVFQAGRSNPIIHRVVNIRSNDNNGLIFETKGDNNDGQILDYSIDERNIKESNILGNAAIKIPFLGWIKILAVELIDLVRG